MNRFTHKGWFGICPVYLNKADLPRPTMVVRSSWLYPLYFLSALAIAIWQFWRTVFDPAYDATGWPVNETARLNKDVWK